VSEFLTLTDEDDGKLFRVRVLNTGEVRIARYHRFSLVGAALIVETPLCGHPVPSPRILTPASWRP
jgi:hypothetical protein